MIQLPLTPHIYPNVATAQAVADANTAGDEDGWTYTVVVDPAGTGKAIVQVADETGFVVGSL